MLSDKSNLLTEGTIWKKIVRFAMPLFWGNLFQQMYNVADSLVVGNFCGSDALAAVGSSGSLIHLLVGFFMGTFTGAGVVIARYFGARDTANVRKSIHTTVAFGIAAGIGLTVLGVLCTPTILRWMGTPASVLPNSVLYFRIYFSGIIFSVLYNTVSGIFRAVGDSVHPLYYLIVSTVTNVVLDIVFIAVFDWGIAGAAYATVIAQALSAALSLRKLAVSDPEYRLRWREIRFDKPLLREILRMGLPSGVQNSIIAFANIIVQSNINAFGAMAMAGCGAYSKIEGFGFLPITSFSLSLTTFVSQNLGAKQYDRARNGARFGIITTVILAELIGIAIYLFSPWLIAAFNSESAVVGFGVAQARTVTLFYFLLAFSHSVAGIMRGAGKATVPMFVMMLCWCVIRITYITIIVRFIPDIRCVFWAYPLTWTLSSIIFLIYYLRADWVHSYDRLRE